MQLHNESGSIPLREDLGGTIRVGGSRVTLDSVVVAYQLGSTPEEIFDSYPSASLSEIYFAIGYYLAHREEVDRYLAEDQAEMQRFRRKIESQQGPSRLRERLRLREMRDHFTDASGH